MCPTVTGALTLEEGEKETLAGSGTGCGSVDPGRDPCLQPSRSFPAGTSRRQWHFQLAGTGPSSPLPWKRGGRKRDATSRGSWSPLSGAVPVPTYAPPAPGAARPPTLPSARPAPAPLDSFPPSVPGTLLQFWVISQPRSYRPPQVSSCTSPPSSPHPAAAHLHLLFPWPYFCAVPRTAPEPRAALPAWPAFTLSLARSCHF